MIYGKYRGAGCVMAGPQEQTSRSSDAIRFRITPSSDFYDEEDPRYTSEAFELQRALRHELPDGLRSARRLVRRVCSLS